MTDTAALHRVLQAEDNVWPTLDPIARYGLAGLIVDAVEDQTEADPAAILIGFLVAVGNMVGDGPTYQVDGTAHHTVLNFVTVGQSAKSRKGTAQDIVEAVTIPADSEWEDRIVTGHLSGEAIVEDLARLDPKDRRLFVREPEFSRLLKIASWKGNTAGDAIRNLFDGKPVHNRRAGGATIAKRHHVSIAGNITEEELAVRLTDTDTVNGFANRILWARVRRQRKLPRGGGLTNTDFTDLAADVNRMLLQARGIGVMEFSDAGGDRYDSWYRSLDDDAKPGLWGAATSRDDVYVIRLAMVYAVCDGTAVIDDQHVAAALAIWDYCDQSARALFGRRSGHRDLDKLVDHLLAAGTDGINGRGLHRLFHNNSRRATQTRERAIDLGVAVEIKEGDTGGRPRQRLYHRDYAPDEGRST